VNIARLGGCTILGVLGVLVGIAGALVQAGWFPGGLLLALAGAAGLFLGSARLVRGRGGTWAAAAGWWLAVLVLLGWVRPEGDFLFGAGLSAYVFLFGGTLAAVMCATLAPPGRPRSGGLGDPVGHPQ
jgi:Family of unknown function (DUF6113)